MKKAAWGCFILVVAMGASARAQSFSVPIRYGATNGVVDEFGQMLSGTPPGSSFFSQPEITGDVVQILQVNAGILPPATNGVPHASNLLLSQTRVGAGVDPSVGPSGKFSGSVTIPARVGTGTNIVIMARAFNAPSLEDASFYADSQMFTVPVFGATSYKIFYASMGATTQMMDGTDYDGDGLTRSWEKSYGSNPDNPDTDGDGMADGPEIRAGTGVSDASSLLIMVQLRPSPPTDLDLFWDSVPGKTYQVDYTTNNLSDNPAFDTIPGTITATGSVSSITVNNGMLTPNAHYRVHLVD